MKQLSELTHAVPRARKKGQRAPFFMLGFRCDYPVLDTGSMSLPEFEALFPDDEACKMYLAIGAH